MLGLLKGLISAGLLVFLLGTLDWPVAASAVKNVALTPLVMAIAILFIQYLISAWKWQIALAIHGLRWGVWALIRIAFIGFFFNNFFPTAIGGDIYRAYRTRPVDGQKSRAISAVLLDRLFGVLALFVIATLGAAYLHIQQQDAASFLLILILSIPPLLASAVPRLIRVSFVQRYLKKLSRVPKLEPLTINARLIFRDNRRLAQLIFVSILFQTLAVVAIALLFAAVRIYGVMAESAIIGAASVLASLLPISINGIGVMESSFALTAGKFGIDFEGAVVVSLMLRLSTIMFSIVGAASFFLDKGRAKDIAAVKALEKSAD